MKQLNNFINEKLRISSKSYGNDPLYGLFNMDNVVMYNDVENSDDFIIVLTENAFKKLINNLSGKDGGANMEAHKKLQSNFKSELPKSSTIEFRANMQGNVRIYSYIKHETVFTVAFFASKNALIFKNVKNESDLFELMIKIINFIIDEL